MAGTVCLRPGRDKAARLRHPWVYSGAIASVSGAPGPGDLVDLTTADGAWLASAARAYKDVNLVALQLLAPDGLLATFSCSGLVSAELFQKIVFGAAVDAGRDVQILARLGQAPDHPVLLSFPEGSYLKGLLCRAW